MTGKTRVLVIDDDPLIRNLLVSALRHDCIVDVAADGCEAFQTALATPPDVAVIDINMPNWDGLKTLVEFRAHPSLRKVKVIMLTADASTQTVKAAVDLGANDYIIKTSFTKSEFYRKLNRLVPGTIADRGTLATHEAAAESVAHRADAVHAPAAAPCRASRQDSEPAAMTLSLEEDLSESRLQEMIDAWE